jgi:hypothetical protein
MSNEIALTEQGELAIYDPEKELQEIVVAEAAEKHWRRAKDATNLCKAIAAKLDRQTDYIVWRDATIVPSQKMGSTGVKGRSRVSALKSDLPPADPGDVVAHRWRKRLTMKVDGRTVADADKLARAKADAQQRAVRICEQQNANTIRGTEGTGEFERYTPTEYVEAVRAVLGAIDLDPATTATAQATVRATRIFTEADNGLEREWWGRVFLNPPYHRELAPKFIDKLIEEIRARRVAAAILLTNNCTDTEWFIAAARICTSICFTSGRIKFTTPHRDEVEPTQGQAFFYCGNDATRFEDVFCLLGFCFRPSRQFEESNWTVWGNEIPRGQMNTAEAAE